MISRLLNSQEPASAEAAPAPAAPPGNAGLTFFTRWLKAPQSVGSLAPSSRYLARAMAQQIPAEAIRDGAPLVELGGGTGSITQGLIEAGMPPKRLIVVERDPTLARLLRARFPSVLVACGDAARLPELLAAYGVSRAASIVSGLPLLLFPEEVLSRLVAGCFALLGPSRPLIQFTYGMGMPLPAGEHGLQARRRAWVFRNLPPAFVWTFTR